MRLLKDKLRINVRQVIILFAITFISFYLGSTYAFAAENGDAGSMSKVGTWILSFISDLVRGVSLGFLFLVKNIFDNVFQFTVVEFAQIYTSSSNGFPSFKDGVETAWIVSRDIANLVIISMFVFSAIATILRIQTYELKKFIVKILIVAVLINFSLFFVQLTIDISNAIAMQLYNTLATSLKDGASIGDLMIYQLKPAELFNTDIIDKFSSFAFGIFYLIVVFFALAMAAAVLAYGSIVMLGRFLGLIIVMALSAAGFVMLLVPGIKEDWFKKWWHGLIRYALFAPALMFMLLVTSAILSKLDSQMNIGSAFNEMMTETVTLQNASSPPNTSGSAQVGSANNSSQNTSSTSASHLAKVVIYLFVVMGLYYQSFKLANSFSLAGSNLSRTAAREVFRAGTIIPRIMGTPLNNSLKYMAQGSGYTAYAASKVQQNLFSPNTTKLIPQPTTRLNYEQKQELTKAQDNINKPTFLEEFKIHREENSHMDNQNDETSNRSPSIAPQTDAKINEAMEHVDQESQDSENIGEAIKETTENKEKIQRTAKTAAENAKKDVADKMSSFISNILPVNEHVPQNDDETLTRANFLINSAKEQFGVLTSMPDGNVKNTLIELNKELTSNSPNIGKIKTLVTQLGDKNKLMTLKTLYNTTKPSSPSSTQIISEIEEFIPQVAQAIKTNSTVSLNDLTPQQQNELISIQTYLENQEDIEPGDIKVLNKLRQLTETGKLIGESIASEQNNNKIQQNKLQNFLNDDRSSRLNAKKIAKKTSSLAGRAAKTVVDPGLVPEATRKSLKNHAKNPSLFGFAAKKISEKLPEHRDNRVFNNKPTATQKTLSKEALKNMLSELEEVEKIATDDKIKSKIKSAKDYAKDADKYS